jgi:hypothetical protein
MTWNVRWSDPALSHIQKQKHEKRVERLKASIRGMMAMCEHARLELNNRIIRFMEKECQAPNAQLLAEVGTPPINKSPIFENVVFGLMKEILCSILY